MAKRIRLQAVERGVVLPIVLVVMMVVTMLVVTQVRRGAVDERLANNWSRAIEGQVNAESLLRYCEATLFARNYEQAKYHYRDRIRSQDYTQMAAWASNVPVADRFTFAANTLPNGATATCVVEDASVELGGGISYQGVAGTPGQAPPEMLKFRFTVILNLPDASAFGSVNHVVQSEVRFPI